MALRPLSDMSDLKFAFRQLLKNPGFTAVAVLTLALGIGATSSVFALMQGALLTPPPYAKPERIALISSTRIDGQSYARGCATAQWLEWQKEARSLEAMAGYNWVFDFLLLPDGSESVTGMAVTLDYFNVIGVKPLIGRAFLDSDAPTARVQATVVMLSHELWQRRFNGDPHIVGKNRPHQPVSSSRSRGRHAARHSLSAVAAIRALAELRFQRPCEVLDSSLTGGN